MRIMNAEDFQEYVVRNAWFHDLGFMNFGDGCYEPYCRRCTLRGATLLTSIICSRSEVEFYVRAPEDMQEEQERSADNSARGIEL